MAVIISGVSAPVGSDNKAVTALALKKAGISEKQTIKTGVHKLSLDARHQNDIKLAASVWAELDPALEKSLCERKDFCSYVDITPFSPVITGKVVPQGRIAIAGFGPAGMFAALVLAESGYKPIVFERGRDVDSRTAAVNAFWHNRTFSPDTNVQFGEGGAGTFSDGKLTTRIKDPLCRYISSRLVEFGAPDEILTSAKPHIGTDKLKSIVKNIRNRIISLGGEVRFGCRVTDIDVKNGELRSVTVNDNEEIAASALIAAIGHSARDTFEMLFDKGIMMIPKPFAVGARIEHKQTDVDRSLYGKHAGDRSLPVGEYQQSFTLNGRGVYTFCMCPGGTVVPSQSEENTVVTNGMSEYARNGENANAALVVAVSPDDYGKGVLDGVNFARKIEQNAFIAAGSDYSAPCVTVGAFLDGKAELRSLSVTPTYACGVTPCDFDKILPSFVTEMMRTGLRKFSGRMECFKDRNAVLTAPETRTSSPVRILRGEDMCSPSAKGLYPCGEGAGYAGGIMSAAVDGVKQACAVMGVYCPTEK